MIGGKTALLLRMAVLIGLTAALLLLILLFRVLDSTGSDSGSGTGSGLAVSLIPRAVSTWLQVRFVS